MKKISIVILASLFVFITGCSKSGKHPCYNAAMAESHSGFCTADCPGVCGCDGKTYCNECEANRNGYEVSHVGPCQ